MPTVPVGQGSMRGQQGTGKRAAQQQKEEGQGPGLFR